MFRCIISDFPQGKDKVIGETLTLPTVVKMAEITFEKLYGSN
jgi:hypothetical protein